MKPTPILLTLALLLLAPTLTNAQTDDVPASETTVAPSEKGWVFGVGLYGGYAPISSPDLDDIFAYRGFQGEQVPSILFGSRVVFGFPFLQIGFAGNHFFPRSDEITTTDAAGAESIRRSEVERSGIDLSLGVPIRRPYYTVTPSVGLGIEQIDISVTERVAADGPFDDESSRILYSNDIENVFIYPQATLHVPLSDVLGLEVIGGYVIPIGTHGSNYGRLGPGIDPSFTLRVGLFINAVDYLAKVPW